MHIAARATSNIEGTPAMVSSDRNTTVDRLPPIPLVAPHRAGMEARYVLAAIEAGTLAGGGPAGIACENVLRQALPARRVVLTSSCTSALHLAGQALDLVPGDEVIVPSFSFASCASVFASLGATIVFADSRPDTFNLDERQVEALIGPRTRALLVVHYGGVPCEMDALLELAARHDVAVIEDCAHGPFASYRGRPLGTMGALAALSFDGAKNLTCGEGGALIVNDPALDEAVEIAFHRGTDRARFLRGEAASYKWSAAGGNYSMSGLQAAFLLAQLDDRERVQHRRRAVWEEYRERLTAWSRHACVQLPAWPPHCHPAFHLFALLFPSRDARDAAMTRLGAHGIASAPHYSPLHLAPGARRFSARPASCPCVEDFHDRLLRLPLHTRLSDGDVDRVVAALTTLEMSITDAA
jgi:dTDP-4-amino-4,6-dideoxygalactose transaminase